MVPYNSAYICHIEPLSACAVCLEFAGQRPSLEARCSYSSYRNEYNLLRSSPMINFKKQFLGVTDRSLWTRPFQKLMINFILELQVKDHVQGRYFRDESGHKYGASDVLTIRLKEMNLTRPPHKIFIIAYYIDFLKRTVDPTFETSVAISAAKPLLSSSHTIRLQTSFQVQIKAWPLIFRVSGLHRLLLVPFICQHCPR